MKTGNFLRRVDELGRVVFPIEIRRKLQIEPGTVMKICMDGESIIIKKDGDECLFCGTAKSLVEVEKKHICEKCLQKIKQI